jgi:hypothetical protein
MVTDSLSRAGALGLPAPDNMQVVGMQVVSVWSAGTPGTGPEISLPGGEPILPLVIS